MKMFPHFAKTIFNIHKGANEYHSIKYHSYNKKSTLMSNSKIICTDIYYESTNKIIPIRLSSFAITSIRYKHLLSNNYNPVYR